MRVTDRGSTTTVHHRCSVMISTQALGMRRSKAWLLCEVPHRDNLIYCCPRRDRASTARGNISSLQPCCVWYNQNQPLSAAIEFGTAPPCREIASIDRIGGWEIALPPLDVTHVSLPEGLRPEQPGASADTPAHGHHNTLPFLPDRETFLESFNKITNYLYLQPKSSTSQTQNPDSSTLSQCHSSHGIKAKPTKAQFSPRCPNTHPPTHTWRHWSEMFWTPTFQKASAPFRLSPLHINPHRCPKAK